MIEDSARQAVKAHWVLPMNGAPKKNAVIEIADGKIIRVATDWQPETSEAKK